MKQLDLDSEACKRLSIFPLEDPKERIRWRELMNKHHYLGFQGATGEQVLYVACIDSTWVGLIGWGGSVYKNFHRDLWIGWDEPRRKQRLKFIANNFRFLILPGFHFKNLASKILSLNLKRLNKDWQDIYGHKIYLVETFVDPKRFKGTCYRACGWEVLGSTKGFSRVANRYEHHGNPKLIFIKPLHKKAAQILSNPNKKLDAKEVLVQVNWTRLPMTEKNGLIDLLLTITDPRMRRGKRHPVHYILAVSICATLSGAKSFKDIAAWAKRLSKRQLMRLGAWRPEPPSLSTIRRVLLMIDAEKFDQKIFEWLRNHNLVPGKVIAIDGKTLKGSSDKDQKAVHLLSAVIHNEGIVIGQKNVGEKTNEIPVIRDFLKPIDIQGCIVTADALHTQEETARQIVVDQKADYVFTVKDNQPTLRRKIEDLNFEDFSPSPVLFGNN